MRGGVRFGGGARALRLRAAKVSAAHLDFDGQDEGVVEGGAPPNGLARRVDDLLLLVQPPKQSSDPAALLARLQRHLLHHLVVEVQQADVVVLVGELAVDLERVVRRALDARTLHRAARVDE